MCTVILAVRPGHDWPLLLAANRDEMISRAWDAPGEYWPDYPGVIAGRDRAAGGTWLGINRHGVIAAILNRQGSLGPDATRRSRGELPLLALAEPTAEAAAARIRALDAGHFRTFNMVLADRAGAIFLRGLGAGHPEPIPLREGRFMVTAHDPNDISGERIAAHLPGLTDAPLPDPASADWAGWTSLLCRDFPTGAEMNIPPGGNGLPGFGTVSSALIALPAQGVPIFRFAPGRPDRTSFADIALSA